MQGVQSIDVATYQVAARPQVRLVDDPGLLRHVSEAPENGLLHKEAVCVWERAEWLRSVVFPDVHNIKLKPAVILISALRGVCAGQSVRWCIPELVVDNVQAPFPSLYAALCTLSARSTASNTYMTQLRCGAHLSPYNCLNPASIASAEALCPPPVLDIRTRTFF